MGKHETIMSRIFEHSMESIIAYQNDGTIILANNTAQEETQYKGQLIGKNIAAIYPQVFSKKEEAFTYILGKNALNSLETVAYCENQTCFPVILKVQEEEIEGEKIGFCFAKDITECKDIMHREQEAIQELSEANKIKNEFMANVTHELRTPVNGMKGLLANLFDTPLDPRQLETVNIIVRSCNNMAKIINDLLDFSKIEAGKMTLEKREFNFHKFFYETMVFHVGRVNEKGLKLIVDFGENIPQFVIGDELRLGQIINNLLSNAIKFTSVGHIAIEVVNAHQSDKEVEIFFMVMDTGIGIAEDKIETLFQGFTQVDGSITRRFGGTGLGLTICKQLIESMGGKIQVDSEQDKGSTFSFSVRLGLSKKKNEKESKEYPEGKFAYARNMTTADFGNPYLTEQGSQDNDVNIRLIPYDGVDESFAENISLAKENLEKLIICVEMGTWEKAEQFAGTVKCLIPEEKQEIKKCAFRLELAVRKEDYEKSMKQIEVLQKSLDGKEEKSTGEGAI